MCRGFFMLNKINFGHVLKMWDFGERYFTATNDWKKKKAQTAPLTSEKKKKKKKKKSHAP